MKSLSCGIDQLPAYLRKKGRKFRVGVLCHPASVDRKFRHLISIVENEADLQAIFGPQHGIYGETQDNMIEWSDFRDDQGRPIYSLYGETRIPREDSLQDLDGVIIDLFDVGARYYTFIYTMSYMMEVCGRLGIEVVVCDRPNPLGGQMVEGPILDPEYRSFVGRYEIPNSHGMTIGELAQFFREQMNPPPKLRILKVRGWQRRQTFSQLGRSWILPSPNLPTFEGCRLYPGMCLLEGSSLSEGRGTTRPFELIGAPFLNWKEVETLYKRMARKLSLQEIVFHRQGFQPSFHKFQGQLCFGALQIIPSSRDFRALRHAALLLWILRKLYGQAWSWSNPPYEYEYEKLPIDILAGSPDLRECIDNQKSLADLFKKWERSEKDFRKIRRPFLLYD